MDKHIIKLFGFICCLGPCVTLVPIIGIGMYYSFFEEEEEKIVWRKVICNGCKKVINKNEAWHVRFGKVPVPFCSLDCALWRGEQSIAECNKMIEHITSTVDNIREWKSLNESNVKNI